MSDLADRLHNELLREQANTHSMRDELDRLTAERDALQERVAVLREWLEADARCPCCDTVDACLDDCTFATDCPQDAGRMAEVRALRNLHFAAVERDSKSLVSYPFVEDEDE